MIHHHAQALEMTALVEDRTGNEDIAKLARRIELSQEGEIELMDDWLAARGEAPEPGAADDHSAHGVDEGGDGNETGARGAREPVPGMLTPAQMDRLVAARGARFDRLFAKLMIQHHLGALEMVADLREQGGGLEPDVYRLSADIEADQEIEVGRMRDMLAGRFGERL